MNKLVKIAILAVFVVVAAFFVYRGADGRQFEKQPTENEKLLYILTQNDCLSCHSEAPQLPFYASFPLVGGEVREDARLGERYFNLDTVVNDLKAGRKLPYVALAKLEQSAKNNTMPMAKYTAIHWLSSLSEEELAFIQSFAKAERAAILPNRLASTAFVDETVQPIPDSLPGLNPEKIVLGKELYHDTRLSKDNTISCATCHDLNGGGVDRLQYSKGIYGQIGGANAPTVYNSVFNIAQFWDGRLPDLQAQAGGPPFDALEMGSTDWAEICGKLNKDNKLLARFKKIYPDGFTGNNITDAIAEFEKTLLTPNSRFDKYLKGDASALNQEELRGFELFKQNNCATCHSGPAMGGLSFEYMGIYGDYLADRAQKQDREIIKIKDQGRYNLTQNPRDLQRYKVPILRNVALTYPYMHDGTVKTLDEATRLMFKYQLNKKPSESDVKSISAFLVTLDGAGI